MKLYKGIFLATVVLIAGCEEKLANDSALNIVNGYKQDPETIQSNGLKFLLGLRFGYSLDPGHDRLCSGFRYGVKSIITSAHCVTEQVSNYDIQPVYLEFVTGTGEFRQKAGPVDIKVHPDYSPKCLETGYQCPDIAVIKLPPEVYNSLDYIVHTDPAEIDFFEKGFPAEQSAIIAGFGCSIDDNLISGRCTAPTFEELTYTVATKIAPRTKDPISLPDHYFQFDGKNSRGEGFAIGSGDSGAPLFRQLAIPKKIRDGDIKSFVVDGIAEFTEVKDGGFGSSMRYDNVVLDLGSPLVSNWLKETLVESGSNGPKPAPPISSDEFIVCQPFDVRADEAPSPVNIPEWTAARLGGAPQLVADNLNSVRNGRTRIALGQCIRFVERALAKIESSEKEYENFDELEATFLAARFSYLQILELVLEMQINKDDMIAALANLHQVQMQGQLQIADAFLSTTPGLSLGYDIVILFSGKNLLGEIDEMEYGITAAGLLVPGVFKGLAKTSTYLKKSVEIGNKTGKYVFKSAKANEKMIKVVKAIEGVEDRYASLIDSAKLIGVDSSAMMRRILRIGSKIEAFCSR